MSKLTHLNKALAAFLFLSIFAGCQKDPQGELDGTGTTDTTATEQGYTALQIVRAAADNRIQRANSLLVWQSDGMKTPYTGQAEDREGGADPNDDIYWLHVGDVQPLEYGGQLLSATHTVVKDNIAYVSYHTRGESHLGAVESIDLTDAEHPKVISQLFFKQADVNAIEIDQQAPAERTRLWIGLSDAKKGGLLGQLRVENGVFTDDFSYVNLSKKLPEGISSSANSIEHADKYLYVTSGKSRGGVYLFNAENLELIDNRVFSDAKYLAASGSEEGYSTVVSLQAGEKSFLRTSVLGKAAFDTETHIGPIVHQNTEDAASGKSTLSFQKGNPNIFYVAMGANGFKAFDLSGGEPKEVWQSPADMLKNGNCNAVTSDKDFLYAANGADGIAVFQLVPGEDPNLVFKWDLSAENASVNFVEADGNFVFAAKGQGGLKILRRPQPGDLLPLTTYDESGRPSEMAADREVCSSLLTSLYELALPEYQNAAQAHPEYFSNPSVPNHILLEEDSDVSITFITEGAGYRNALGYYYYDAANPPSSVDDLTKIIIFANASAVGSGGELVPGNTMQLLGSFTKNTVIGFFLIADAWNGERVTNGSGTIYTEPDFNPGKSKQSLIFHDQECASTVVCFEDIVTAWGGDLDYNDAIFQVTTSPATAINVGQYLQVAH